MRYPKPWNAGMPAGPTYVASSREDQTRICVGSYINRPDTPDHTRLIRTYLTIEEAEKLRDHLTHQIALQRGRP